MNWVCFKLPVIEPVSLGHNYQYKYFITFLKVQHVILFPFPDSHGTHYFRADIPNMQISGLNFVFQSVNGTSVRF